MTFKSFLQQIQILSLDVVAGSFASFIMAWKILNMQAPAILFIIIPLCVWIVYTTDHLIDGIKLKESAIAFRHRFHYAKQFPLIAFVLFLCFMALLLSFLYLPREIHYFGLLMGMFIMLYLSLVYVYGKMKRIFIPKEFVIALVYTAGIWGAPVLLSTQVLGNAEIMIIAEFLLLAFGNTILLSYFEYKQDSDSGQVSFSIQYGLGFTRIFLITLFVLLIALGTIGVLLFDQKLISLAFLIFSVMAAIMLWMILHPASFYKHKMYKWLIESVFLLPALILLDGKMISI